MFKPDVAFYLGEQKKGGYSGIVSQDNLFFVIEIGSGISEEVGHRVLDFVKEKIKGTRINNLSDFENFIINIIKEKNLPAGFSLASAYLKDSILYLKTSGSGEVYIRRKGKLGLLIEGDATASGPVEDMDFFIFVTENFLNLVLGRQGLEKTFDHRSPTEIIDEITPGLKAKQDIGAVALFVNLKKIHDESFTGFPGGEVEEVMAFSWKDRLISTKQYLQAIGRQKTLTFITVFVLFLILLWSVVLGYQRRTSAGAQNKIKLARELVTQKLSTAEDVAYLNMSRALILISESKEEVAKLKKEIGDKRKEAVELEQLVKETENKILKKEMRQYSEFFDLGVDDKNASGNRIYLDGETAFILDNKRSMIYKLSLEKKSLQKDRKSEVKSASLVAGFETETFFYAKGSGVFRIDKEGKLKKVIDNDKDWVEISGIYLYNGNIYLLDRGRDEVWKYLRGEDGYGSKNSYFESGQAIDLSSINSLGIDGSVYLVGDSIVIKYTSGLRDGFKIDLPDEDTSFSKVFTAKDLEKIYLWDKSKAVVYVLSKTGEYIEQVNSEILSKGSDMIVYKEKIYILVGNKIFKIE
ncbi:hypothetical protein HZA76_03015 [Candidatus Roizmanbacteria bacterium]|nr:hypothetical protein [Candidatus Roizmanbacteria bacterium]